jgi:hypothetical protein
MTGDEQLDALGRLHDLFTGERIDYWLFGGWAVDFHAGRVTRRHGDIDLAIWGADLVRLSELLEQRGWRRIRQPGEDGFAHYRNGSIHLDLAFLARDQNATVYTPLEDGRGEWPPGSFGRDERELLGVRARVVGLASLVADKSEVRDDPSATAKDRADVAALIAMMRED